MLVVAGIATISLCAASVLQAQDRQSPQPQGREPADDGPQQFRGGPPGFALLEALDKDRDGKMSADELKSAAGSLKALDRNSDGKLDAQEIGWPPQFGPFGRRGGRGRGPGGFGGPGAAPVAFSTRIMNRDADHNGKVAADELPRSMRRIIQLADTNEDGAIDESEAKKFADKYGDAGRGAR
jgi:hypothetical protein